MNTSSIVFVIIYTGNFPWYFPYFIHSCRYNPTIDFLIFTDNKNELPNVPSNVHFIPYSLEQFNENATKALGFEIAICDFKPTLPCVLMVYPDGEFEKIDIRKKSEREINITDY